jgi:hypothetical protein
MTTLTLTKSHARKVLSVVDAGLCSGKGVPEPGKMCVEAAVCFALGLPHSDDPPCVGKAVREFKIQLNDSSWSSDKARARGLRRLAIAQLGSDSLNQTEFVTKLQEATIRQVVPRALRHAAECHQQQVHKDALEAAAKVCADEGTESAAWSARAAAWSARAAGVVGGVGGVVGGGGGVVGGVGGDGGGGVGAGGAGAGVGGVVGVVGAGGGDDGGGVGG